MKFEVKFETQLEGFFLFDFMDSLNHCPGKHAKNIFKRWKN